MHRHPVYVICNNIRSLYNVGAIFRTSDAANIEKICLCGITGYPKENDPTWFQTAKIEKTALGANKTVLWKYYQTTEEAITELKKTGIKIYALENTDTAADYKNFNYQFPCALVLGHEVNGISQNILDLTDGVIKLPMYGTKTSLNVEAAYAIAIYEMIDHYKKT